MGFEELISEERASSLIGASKAELGELVRGGKLRVEVDEDGSRYFSKEEVETLQNSSNRNESFCAAGQGLVIEKIILPEDQENQGGIAQEPLAPSGSELEASLGRLRELQQIAEDQERLLDTRDGEILRVSREVEWLKGRIAKLDNRQERERILTDTCLIKKAVEKKVEPRGFWRGVMEWLGVVRSG